MGVHMPTRVSAPVGFEGWGSRQVVVGPERMLGSRAIGLMKSARQRVLDMPQRGDQVGRSAEPLGTWRIRR